MQNPFEAIIANRQISVPTRQVIQCDYFNPSVQGNIARITNASQNILTLDQCRFNNTTVNIPDPLPLSGLSFTLQNLLDAFKACYLDQLFDPIIPMYNLMEGFLLDEDHSAQFAQLLSSIIIDLVAMSPIFLEGGPHATAAFRPGRLLLLLYPFLFSEKIPFQQMQVDKTSSNSIGYQLIKTQPPCYNPQLQSLEKIQNVQLPYNLTLTKLPFSRLQSRFSMLQINQFQILLLKNSMLATLRKEKELIFLSKYPIALNILNLELWAITLQLKSLELPTLQSSLEHKESCHQFCLKILVHLLDYIFKTFLHFIEGIHLFSSEHMLSQLDFQTICQMDSTLSEIHKQTKTSLLPQDFIQYSKPCIKRLNQQSRARDLQQDGARLLLLEDPPNGQDADHSFDLEDPADEIEQHRVIDGTGAFITTLTLRAQREYVSNYLVNAPPQLEMRLN